MSSRKWVSFAACLTPILLFLAACSDEESKYDNWKGVCIDADGDGYGLQCQAGADCNDADPSIHTGCGRCDRPSEGCECAAGTPAITCAETPNVTSGGDLICKSGMRYCRDGAWTACEVIHTFTAPPPSQLKAKFQGLIATDASRCSECNPDCYEVQDPLDVIGAGDAGMLSADGAIAYTTNGGITLNGTGNRDASAERDADELTPVPPCDTSLDSDCDGIPNSLDPFPGEKPFETTLSTIFMDIAPGQTKSNTFDLRFYLRSADIYFLLDMTGSMAEERDKLISSLKTGNYLNDPDTADDESLAIECADRNFDGVPDNSLKNGGVAGNIACLIRNSAFGAGWYRELPFSASDDYNVSYSYPNFELFQHRLDVTDDVNALNTALNKFVTRGNVNWAEAAIPAMWAVATGEQLYLGWDRGGIPKRTCPGAKWGYPCFRADAMPIMIHITDAPMMNGPVPTQGHLGGESGSTYPSGKQYVNYTDLGLSHVSKTPDATYNTVSGNETLATAKDVGVIDNSFKTYAGDTSDMAADLYPGVLPSTCPINWPSNSTTSSNKGYPDAVFKFKVTNPNKRLTVSTRGTHHKPTLAIIPVSGGVTPTTASNNATAASATNLGVLTSAGKFIVGDTDSSTFSSGEVTREQIAECVRGDGTATDTAPDAWFKFTVSQNMNNVSFSADGSDFEAILGLWAGTPVAVTETSFSSRDNNKVRETESALPGGSPGTLDGKSHWLYSASTNKSSITADYAASLFTGSPSCSTVSSTRYDGVVDFTLGSTRTVRIETTAHNSVVNVAGFDHALGLFTRPASGSSLSSSNVLTCDRNALATNRSFIERTLNAGSYSVVIRGHDSNSDRGSYGLLISDTAARPVGCHNQSQEASFTANLKTGVTYYLAMRGRSTSSSYGSGRGPYTIRINTAGAAHCHYNDAWYTAKSNDSGMNLGTSEVVDYFPVGEYYAIVKGNGDFVTQSSGDQGRGPYQITFGDQSLATNNQVASIPQWGDENGGVYKELKDRDIRVINVTSTKSASCGWSTCSGGSSEQNAALKEQADTISSATGAKGVGDVPLRFDIFTNGDGMGFAVVDAIARLSNNVAMNVSATLVTSPDTPAKPFTFVSRAVDTPGDSCSGPIDTNGDGVLDTHTACRPGATPRFEVKFTNPSSPNHVEPNPAAGSNGGYNMEIDLVGDGKYVIDRIPVFIIPEDVIEDDDPFQYSQTGSYAQDVTASCTDTDRPLWQSLAWTDSLPAGTSLQWNMCLGDTTAELDSCENSNAWITAVTVTPGGTCSTSSQCMNGYCSAGKCRQPVAPSGSCSVDSDCGGNGVCVSNACAWTANPISLLPTLRRAGANGKGKLRIQLKMTANEDRTLAPSVQDFRVIYTCTPGL